MTRESIRLHYQTLVEQISEQYSHYDVPPDVQHYYLLCELLTLACFEKFVNRYGMQPIDIDFAQIGKDEYLNLGKLDPFEREVCELWAKNLSQLDKRNNLRLL